MKRTARCLTLLGAMLGASFAHAKELPNFDASYEGTSTKASPAYSARSNVDSRMVVTAIDPRHGIPSFIWAARDASAPVSLKAPTAPATSARAALSHVATRIGLPAAVVDSAVISDVDDGGNGGFVVRFTQEFEGIEVFRGRAAVMLDKSQRLLAVSNNLHPEAISGSKRVSRSFAIAPADALASALGDWQQAAIPTEYVVPKGQADRYVRFDLLPVHGIELASPARVKRVYFSEGNRLIPAYFVEMRPKLVDEKHTDAYAYVIAANDARVLLRENLTHDFKYRVWADPNFQNRPFDGPQADYNPHPTGMPDGSVPEFSAPALVTMDGFNKNPQGTFDPWLPANATVTTGNNVDAYADLAAADGFTPTTTDVRATTTAAQTFDRTYDTLQEPAVNQNQVMAAVTQLFYTVNYLHDYWYDSGFDEAGGNAQAKNFGRGGVENDAMRAEAQDYSGANNANMQTFADGESPIMQMYVWDPPSNGSASLVALSQTLIAGEADFGPPGFDLTANLILATDATQPAGDGCQAIQQDLKGKIAIVDRGACTFKTKALNAQTGGAIGIIIADNQSKMTPPKMADDAQLPAAITIPTLSVTTTTGDSLKQALQSGAVSVTMKRTPNTAPKRDGTIDNLIVTHEWGHYIHLRLVSCGSTMCGSESEGWGDFLALHTTVREGDNLDATFNIGSYATAALGDSGYFGIRRIPYSVDMSKNALTFQHIANSSSLPSTHPVQNIPAPNAEVHNAGEIWATMMWEALVGILKRSQAAGAPYTFEEGRRRMADYVVRGMKLAPVSPTFLEQRDAILAAAAAADVDDMMIIANAFAKRGAGSCAISPPTNSGDNSGLVESYELKANVQGLASAIDDAVQSCDQDGKLDAQEHGRIKVDFTNSGVFDLTDAIVEVSTSSPGVSFPKGPQIPLGPLAPFEVGHAEVEIALDGTFAFANSINLEVSVLSAKACLSKTSVVRIPYVHYDDLASSSNIETAESEIQAWTRSGAGADSIWRRELEVAPNHVWHGDDTAGQTDASLESPSIIAGTDPITITLNHRWSFEVGPPPEGSGTLNYDGAVMEISTNDGLTWQDIASLGTNPYNGTITDISENPLGTREGFVALSDGYPAFSKTKIELGDAVANKTFKVRFRIGSDAAAGDVGWDIDEIKVEGAMNKPFASIIDNAKSCPGTPIAVAGPDVTVATGDTVKLDGSKSNDPEGDALTFEWSQVDGPMVVLAKPTSAATSFVAPKVAEPTPITFRLKVSDGKAAASDKVVVTVDPKAESASGGTNADEGCGCVTVGSSTTNSTSALSLLGLLGLAAARLRRRQS